MCEKVVGEDPWNLRHVPSDPKFQESVEKAVKEVPRSLEYAPDDLKMQEICDNAVRVNLLSLEVVPDCFKTQEMCNEAVATTHGYWGMSSTVLKHKKYATKQLKWAHGC